MHRLVTGKTSSAREAASATALQFADRTDTEGFPANEAWEKATPIQFDADWQGEHADPQRETEVRLLWTRDALHLRFLARYRSLSIFTDAEPNGRRDQLWDRDVVEAFLQPDHGPGDIDDVVAD